MKRGMYITKGDEEAIRKTLNPTDQFNMLTGKLRESATGRHGVISDLLLSVMDSYEASEGGKSRYHHWDFAQILIDTGE